MTDSFDEDLIEEDNLEEIYDGFNDLTFASINTLIDDFNFSKPFESTEPIKTEIDNISVLTPPVNTTIAQELTEKLKSVDKENNAKPSTDKNDLINSTNNCPASFKMSIHPVLMLSDPHRRKVPGIHYHSMNVGRYDGVKGLSMVFVNDSLVMTTTDKLDVIAALTSNIFLIDHIMTRGSRDYYYWAYYFKRSGHNACSKVINYQSILDYGGSSCICLSSLIRTFPSTLGCIYIASPTFPRLSIDLKTEKNSITASKTLKKNNYQNYAILKCIESLFNIILDVECAIQKFPLSPADLKQQNDVLVFGMHSIVNTLTQANSPLGAILNFQKGRKLIIRCIYSLHISHIAVLLDAIYHQLCNFNYTLPQLESICFDVVLTNTIYSVASKIDPVVILKILSLVCSKKENYILLTFAGTSLLAALIFIANLNVLDAKLKTLIIENLITPFKLIQQNYTKINKRLFPELQSRLKSIKSMLSTIKAGSTQVDLNLKILSDSLSIVLR